MPSRADYERLALQAEQAGNLSLAEKYRKLAERYPATGGAPTAAPPVLSSPVVVTPDRPPDDRPLADQSIVGKTTSELRGRDRQAPAPVPTVARLDTDTFLAPAAEVAAPAPAAVPGQPRFAQFIPREAPRTAGGLAPFKIEEPQVKTPIRPTIAEYPDIVPFQAGEPVLGREFDVPESAVGLGDALLRLRDKNINYYVNTEGYSLEQAEALAQKDITDVLRARMNVEGEPTSRGEGFFGFIPFARESRVDFSKQPFMYTEEDGTTRPATEFEIAVESLARQPAMTPEESVKRRQVRAVERELAFEDIPGSMLYRPDFEEEVRKQISERADPFFETVFTEVDPQTGRILETPLARVFQNTGMVSTLVNEAALGALPLFYDIDKDGNPNKDQFAYKAHRFLVDSALRLGVADTEAEAEDIFSGVVGGSVLPTGIPVPFSGIRRASPTVLDPTGFRAVTETETFLGDVALGIAKGRFLGDELASIDGYSADLARADFYNNNDPGTGKRLEPGSDFSGMAATFYPMVLGAGVEMLYGIGPLSALGKTVRLGGKGLNATSRVLATGAGMVGMTPQAIERVTKIGQYAEAFTHPVEMSKREKNVRAIQDLLDGAPEKPDIDLLMDLSTAQRVAADVAAKDILTPYLIQQAVQAGITDAKTLRRIAGDSKSGNYFLLDAGIKPGVPDDFRISPDGIETATLRFRRSVHADEIAAIIADKTISEDVKAGRIFALLQGPLLTGARPTAARQVGEFVPALQAAGVQPNFFDDLGLLATNSELARFKTTRELMEAFDAKTFEDFVAGAGATVTRPGVAAAYQMPYPRVRAGAPVYKTLHEFGEMVADQGRQVAREAPVPTALSREEVPTRALRGPAAESYLRRVGGAVPTPEVIRQNPEIVREAAIGAGSRVIASTLENVVPSDMVFVTSTLMVPRQSVTPERIARVREISDTVERKAVIGPVVDGKKTVVFEWDITPTRTIELLGGPEAIRRSPLKQTVLRNVANKSPLSAAEHQILEDALLTDAYRQTFGERALDAVFAGKQTEQAREPSVSLGLISRLTDTTGEVQPRQARPLAEAREPSIVSLPFQAGAITRNLVGSAVLKAGRTFKSENAVKAGQKMLKLDYAQTPVGYETALNEMKRAVSSIPDNFQRELRDAVARTDDPEAAFNALLERRAARELREIDIALQDQVRALEAQGMPRDEAMSLLAYQNRAGRTEEALGRFIALEGKVADAQAEMQKPLFNAAAENNWKQVLQAFFGPEVYGALLDPVADGLFPYITVTVKNADGQDVVLFRPIDTQNVREVIRLIRADNLNLELRGAQRAKFPGGELLTQFTGGQFKGTDDAVFEVLAAWAMGKDKQVAVQQAAKTLVNNNPWMVTDLVPSFSSAGGGYRAIHEIDAAVNARAEVLTALETIGVQPGVAREAIPEPVFRGQQKVFGRMRALMESRLVGVETPPGTPSPLQTQRRVAGTPFLVPSEMTAALNERLLAAKRKFENNLLPPELREVINTLERQLVETESDLIATQRELADAREGLSIVMARAAAAERALPLFQRKTTDLLLRRLGKFSAAYDAIREARAQYNAKISQQASLFTETPFEDTPIGKRLYRRYEQQQEAAKKLAAAIEQGNQGPVKRMVAAQDKYYQTLAEIGRLDDNLTRFERLTEAETIGLREAYQTGIDAVEQALAVRGEELAEYLQRVASRAPGARGPEGRFTRALDNLTTRAYRNLNTVTRAEFVQYIYSRMLAEGTQNPDLLFDVAKSLDDPKLNLLFFEKQATTESIGKIIARLDRAPKASLSDSDKALYDAIQRARKAPMTPAEPFTPEIPDLIMGEIPETSRPRVGLEPVAMGPVTPAQRAQREAEIIESIRRALLKNAMESFVLPAVEEAQQNARAWGWAPDLERTRDDMLLFVNGLNPNDPRFLVAGQDFMEQVAELQAASADGRLAINTDALMKSDKLARAYGGDRQAAVDYVVQTVQQALMMPRTLAAGGMLAGGFYLYTTEDGEQFPIPAPNTRYLGMNISTLPFILATTLGAGTAVRFAPGLLGPRTQAGEVTRQIAAQAPEFMRRPLVNTLSPGVADEVLFTSDTGRAWTRAEFFEAVDRNSINISRGNLEFAEAYGAELLRDARLTAAGVKSGALRQYLLRNLDPTRTGIFQYIANSTDKAVRQNVFASALKSGMTEEQAAQLARSSVLDYGKTGPIAKSLNKYILFLAFREAMMRETIGALARDPDTLNRTILLHRDLSKQMDDELKADYGLTRLPVSVTSVFDYTAASRVYGPVHPTIDMYADAVQFAGWVLQTGADDIPPGVVVQAVADENLTPIVNYIIADFAQRPGAGGRGAKVPDEWVAYAIQNSPDNLWPMMKDYFNIEPVIEPEQMQPGRLRAADRPGAPMTEYRFRTPADAAKFARFLAALQVFGFERTTSDYTKLGLTYGVSDAIDPQKRGLPSPFGFAVGLETPMGEQSPEALQRRAIREQQRRARAMTKEQ